MNPKSFEEACASLGYDPATIIPDLHKQPEWLRPVTEAGIKLDVIAEAIRKGKQPVKGQELWFPVFRNDDHSTNSGFGFSDSNTDIWCTDTDVGARRSFFTEEDADYFAEQFIELHRIEKCFGVAQ